MRPSGKRVALQHLVVRFGVPILALFSALVPLGRAPVADAPAAGLMEVTVGDGRLSVNLRDAPLAEVLRRIGQAARLTIHLEGRFGTPISGAFTALPLEAGIRRLTRGHSSTFAYDPPHPGRPARLAEIWVIESAPAAPADPRVSATRRAAVNALARRRDEAAVAELRRMLAEDSDPSVRAQAARALGRSRDARVAPALAAALGDQHPSVRIQAVHGLQRLEGERAVEALGRVLLGDPDPAVRRSAAFALALLRDAKAGSALGTAMSTDSDASVRRTAAAAYRRWQQRPAE
jgi:HEAT repeat protein